MAERAKSSTLLYSRIPFDITTKKWVSEHKTGCFQERPAGFYSELGSKEI